ncbi:CPXCG motif-containing cysteine-rich protein [Salinimicrobium oceani]|uniref:CPXCG motif-containing cysteine-rich protein n=1 Tax=Salinimicrobium oceani TaxID=2722702 RepID=A0ABX1CZA2_9FLAO|nr:CPXCG motif-containing cysteine-rich protein [Salinimicrobium oceani]NJW53598.1 CPXCG motif-containing cysteine-rich protein [Salinimicrobium oceani]
MLEQFFVCPYCAEEISMLIDPSEGRQDYIEDCEVCCNPIELHFNFENGQILEFHAQRIEQ